MSMVGLLFYMIEAHHINNMDFMAGCRDKQFQLAIVDPQYGLGEDGRKTKGREGMVPQPNGTKIFYPARDYKHAGYDDAPPIRHTSMSYSGLVSHKLFGANSTCSSLKRVHLPAGSFGTK